MYRFQEKGHGCTIYGLCHELGHAVDNPWKQGRKTVFEDEQVAWEIAANIYKEVYGVIPPNNFFEEKDRALANHSSNPKNK